jgi:hypothetical protein
MLPGDCCMLNWFLEFAEALLGEALAMITMSPSHVRWVNVKEHG